jgi:hypothetical protein
MVRAIPAKRKRELIGVALNQAIEHKDVRWADWLTKNSGDASDTFDPNLLLLLLWQQWQLTPDQEERVRERLAPEIRNKLTRVFDGEVMTNLALQSDDAGDEL